MSDLQKRVDALKTQVSTLANLAKAGRYDESKHRRHPKGHPKGGKFAPKGGVSSRSVARAGNTTSARHERLVRAFDAADTWLAERGWDVESAGAQEMSYSQTIGGVTHNALVQMGNKDLEWSIERGEDPGSFEEVSSGSGLDGLKSAISYVERPRRR